MRELETLVALSRKYGSDPEWVLAGGGNTSYKDAKTLYVKASGTSLGTISAEGFCAMDRAALNAIWSRSYPEGAEAREAAALADLMAARLPGEAKRPSVETLMHGFFPQAYVVHSHPAAINGLTCGRDGEAAFGRLFAREAVWLPFVDPGYTLARTVMAAVEAFRGREGVTPALMFMRNHGFLAAADDPAEIDRLSGMVMSRIASQLRRVPDRSAAAVDARAVAETAARLARLAGEGSALLHSADADLLAFAASRESFAPLSSAFTPDHIVYAGHEFLYIEGAPEGLDAAWQDYLRRNGSPPRILVVRGLGAYAVGRGRDAAKAREAAGAAMLLFADACKIAVYAESFGGALHMTRDKIDFIRNWEVERYRASVVD